MTPGLRFFTHFEVIDLFLKGFPLNFFFFMLPAIFHFKLEFDYESEREREGKVSKMYFDQSP